MAIPWRKGYLYRWNGADWEEIDPVKETAPYMEALMDLTEGAPDGRFTAIFCRVIGAQQALIDTLMARVLTMTGDGVIQSEGFTGIDGNVKGYRLTARNGRIEANHGVFKDIDIFGTSTFAGNINSGMLQVSVNSAESHWYEYGPGTQESTIRQTNRNLSLIGVYGDKAFNRFDIVFTEDEQSYGQGFNTYWITNAKYSLYVVYTDNTREKIAESVYSSINYAEWSRPPEHYEFHNTVTSKHIRYKYLGTGNSIKLLGLPNYTPSEIGELCYDDRFISQDGTALLHIKVR
jgi:hypothetical protein